MDGGKVTKLRVRRSRVRSGFDGTWKGGRVWRDADGVATYIVRKSVGGKRYSVSTRCTDETAALVQLGIFESNPEAYSPQGDAGPEPVYLDEERITAFLAWSKEKGNKDTWRRDQRRYLVWWGQAFHGVDLRGASLDKAILPPLDAGTPARAQKIRVLRTFYAWLREVRRVLRPQEDPTWGALKTPQAEPEQWRRVKAVPRADYLRVLGNLQARESERKAARERRYADLLQILAGTGWHVTELYRFVRAGGIERLPVGARASKSEAGVLVTPEAKGGAFLKTRVSEVVLAAAERQRRLGGFSRERFDDAVRGACTRAGVETFLPGQMRHSVATWATDRGAALKDVSTFLGHKSERTTRRFYATHGVAGKVPTLA